MSDTASYDPDAATTPSAPAPRPGLLGILFADVSGSTRLYESQGDKRARELIGQGANTFVEVGPGNVLGGLLKRIDSSVRAFSVNDLKSLDAAVNELG